MPDNKMIENLDRVSQRGKKHTSEHQEGSFSPAVKAEQLFGLYREYLDYKRPLYRRQLRDHPLEKVGTQLPEEETSIRRQKRQEQKVKIEEEIGSDPLVAKLEGEISRLWDSPQVKVIFLERVGEAIKEREPHEGNLRSFDSLHRTASELEEEYQTLMRNHFLLRQMTPTLRGMEIARNRVEREQINKRVGALETPKKTAEGLLPLEKADLASLIAYERLNRYHREFHDQGFIRTPSRQALLEQILTQTANGTWILLTGETGSGKTQLATVVSKVLNDEPPLYASGEERGDVTRLIGTKAMTAQGESYYEFGPLVAAMTGFTTSQEAERSGDKSKQPKGKIVVVDELNKFNQDALFGALKVGHNVREGETFNYKELPGVTLRRTERGFGLIGTRNPATVRYERHDLDPALERLFYNGKITIDYPPMSNQDPELYEMFLAILIDENGRIRISKDELAPSFRSVKDDAKGTVTQEIDPDVTKHGTLYRFALAVSEVHKSFNQKPNVARVGTDEGYLERTVLEMGVLVDWMRSYKSEIEGGMSLTTYLEKKLHGFYSNIDNETDKVILNRIFNHFAFDIDQEPAEKPRPHYDALTPLEMGYLTPRTERVVRKIGEEATPKTKLEVLADGTPIYYQDTPLIIGEDQTITPRSVFEEDGKKSQYLGLDPETGEAIFIPVEE